MGQDQWEKEDAFEMYFEAVNEKSDPELSKRKENTPAGMKNLGATCYANSLLQVWFHDLAFRDVIYKCDFDMDTDKAMFQGKYSYNTTCKNCKTTSARDCSFYELMLNIKDNCTLMDCFEEFVEPELLVGADRSQKWFVLNDEGVAEFSSTIFDPEEYSSADSKAKAKGTAMKPGDTAGNFLNNLSSRNAYMLTYTKKADISAAEPYAPPAAMLEIVNRDNAAFSVDLKHYAEHQDKIRKDFELARRIRRDIYQCWHVDGEQDAGCYVSAEALAGFMQLNSKADKRQTGTSQTAFAIDNTGIVCEHGKICPTAVTKNKLYNITHRRDVEEFERKLKGVRSPLAAWVSKRWISEWTKMSPRFHPTHGTALEVLTRVFGTLHLPEADMDECEECHIQLQPELESKKDMLARAATEKSELADLFMIGTKLRQMEPEVKYNVISHDFLKQWLDFVKKPTINPRPASLDNKGLLCQHGQFMFDLDNAVDVENDKGIAIVKDEEWVHLQELVLDFSSTTLTVRVYSASSTGANSRGVLVQSNDESEAAALASQPSSSPSMGSSSKRKNGAAPSSVQNGMRRSKRAKATKSPFKQIKVLVSKWDTVMDLKLKIMEKANIVPLYQKLLYEQTEFDKNDKTIGDLKIPPNAVLTLIEYDETMDEQLLENLQGRLEMNLGSEAQAWLLAGSVECGSGDPMDLDSEIQGSGKIDTAIPRQLVLDYLLHNCYGETARAFMKDDLDAVKESDSRKGASTTGNSGTNSCRHGLQNGSNGNLSSNGMHRNGSTAGTSHTPAGMAWSSEGNHQSDNDPTLLMETEKEEELDEEGDSPMADSFFDSSNDNITSGTFTADKAHALHIDEQLKNLETRKERAIELCNTAFPGVLSIDPNSPLTSPASIQMNFRLQCQLFIEKLRSDPERSHEAIMFAQDVVSNFNRLDPPRKEQYTTRFVEFVSVVAFSNPEESPNGHLMKQEARDQLAEMMNSAVLGYNGMSCEPALLTIVKQATLVRDILAGEPSKTKRGLKGTSAMPYF
ncbi:hypothetical protein BGX28_001730 [Mortierella sp. GBA30]|nr:hypothetical protein BGX28_001730 [Mortierella sp. GBA30]